jgi:ABC-type transport system substrate-binding protein
VVLTVAACSSSPSPAASGPAGSASPAASVAASAAAATGGTLSVAYQSDIQSLDPAIGYDVVSWPAERLIFDGLVAYDQKTTIVPRLAVDLPVISADGLTYTFKLRPDVNFVKQDGSVLRPITADDVVYSINRVLDPKLTPTPSPVSSSFFSVIAGAQDVIDGKATSASGARAVDATTVEFTLANPDPTFLNKLATPFASVVPKEFAQADTTAFSKAPIGTGPFLLKDYTKGQHATFVRNPHYWQAGQPLVDAIDFRVGVDATSALQQVQAGTLDIMGDNIPSGSYSATINDPNLSPLVHRMTGVNTMFMIVDTSAPGSELSNPKVRQALQYAIDKENVVKVMNGRAKVADCIFPPDLPGFDPNCKPYSYDPAKAKQMLADAGYPNGFKTTLYTDTTDPDPAIAQALQQDLKAVGIEAELITQSFDVLVGTLTTPHAAPLMFLGWFQDYPDPSDFIDPIFSCAVNVPGAASYGWLCDKAIDKLSADAKKLSDRSQYLAAFQEIQRRLMEASPVVPIDHQETVVVVAGRVTNFFLHPVWTFDFASYGLSQ